MLAPILLSFGFLSQQRHIRDYTTPPSKAPISCSISEMASLLAIQGSDSYVAIRYELESLSKAEEGAKIMDQTSDEVKKSTDLGAVLTKMLSGTENGQDHLLCAAYIMGKLPIQNKDYQTAAQTLISTYNRRVEQMQRLIDRTKKQMLGGTSESRASKLRLAEENAALEKDQRQVTQDALDAIVFSVMLTVDTNDPNSKTTEFMKFSCDEREDILNRSKQFESTDSDDFVASAKIISEAVDAHKCR